MNPSFLKSGKAKRKNNKSSDYKNTTIRLSRHKPAYNAPSLNRAVERAIKDEKFLRDALETIKPIKFPTYKREIVNYLKTTNQEKDKDILSLFESLDGYIQYNDLYHD